VILQATCELTVTCSAEATIPCLANHPFMLKRATGETCATKGIKDHDHVDQSDEELLHHVNKKSGDRATISERKYLKYKVIIDSNKK
jgi:hypothetical protein